MDLFGQGGIAALTIRHHQITLERFQLSIIF